MMVLVLLMHFNVVVTLYCDTRVTLTFMVTFYDCYDLRLNDQGQTVLGLVICMSVQKH